MPAVSGDRFSSQNMADCSFCPPEGRLFRTQRQCSGCQKPLCLVCRPMIPGGPYLCPDCGGGAVANALADPAGCIERIAQAGQEAPYWLLIAKERMAGLPPQVAEELIVPE